MYKKLFLALSLFLVALTATPREPVVIDDVGLEYVADVGSFTLDIAGANVPAVEATGMVPPSFIHQAFANHLSVDLLEVPKDPGWLSGNYFAIDGDADFTKYKQVAEIDKIVDVGIRSSYAEPIYIVKDWQLRGRYSPSQLKVPWQSNSILS
ncbi:hypothetical protein GBO34_00770 [Roseivirga pacifica]|uniref:hypothetical protein n=1 Tax=Roseivirga pacifica TaxID=1267423 RepID=UPI0020948537|nr:hypothetical protein [Roseivirga pacifica]MCO6367845.1 hypothetical protein [Roseivirga pacifica]MCO6377217.1 hypothetical protein [Roseivirga pacifica]